MRQHLIHIFVVKGITTLIIMIVEIKEFLRILLDENISYHCGDKVIGVVLAMHQHIDYSVIK